VRRGPIPALLLCTYSVPDRETGKSAKASHVVVSSSARALDGFIIDNPSFGNAGYLAGLLNSLSGRGEEVMLRTKSFSSAGLMLSRATVNTLGAVLIFVIPALILAAGIVFWAMRRRA
jgi:hypothetical protein